MQEHLRQQREYLEVLKEQVNKTNRPVILRISIESVGPIEEKETWPGGFHYLERSVRNVEATVAVTGEEGMAALTQLLDKARFGELSMSYKREGM